MFIEIDDENGNSVCLNFDTVKSFKREVRFHEALAYTSGGQEKMGKSLDFDGSLIRFKDGSEMASSTRYKELCELLGAWK